MKFATKESAANAIVQLHNTQLLGSPMKCAWGRESNATTDPALAHLAGQHVGLHGNPHHPLAASTFPVGAYPAQFPSYGFYPYATAPISYLGYGLPQGYTPATTSAAPNQYAPLAGTPTGTMGYLPPFYFNPAAGGPPTAGTPGPGGQPLPQHQFAATNPQATAISMAQLAAWQGGAPLQASNGPGGPQPGGPQQGGPNHQGGPQGGGPHQMGGGPPNAHPNSLPPGSAGMTGQGGPPPIMTYPMQAPYGQTQ